MANKGRQDKSPPKNNGDKSMFSVVADSVQKFVTENKGMSGRAAQSLKSRRKRIDAALGE